MVMTFHHGLTLLVYDFYIRDFKVTDYSSNVSLLFTNSSHRVVYSARSKIITRIIVIIVNVYNTCTPVSRIKEVKRIVYHVPTYMAILLV